jgi:hypothetical protein
MPSLTGFETDRVGTYIVKDPYAALDYSLDFTNWLPQGETLTALSVTVETISGDASPLALDLSTNTTTVATAFLSGGTAGKIYNVEYRITTNNSKTDSRNIRVKVQERQA